MMSFNQRESYRWLRFDDSEWITMTSIGTALSWPASPGATALFNPKVVESPVEAVALPDPAADPPVLHPLGRPFQQIDFEEK